MGPSAKGKEMIVIVSVLVGLACLSMALRFVARVKRRTGFGVDDCLCFVAVILMLGMLIELILWCFIGGNGYHFSDLDTRTITLFYKIFLSSQFTYFVLTPVIKISLICFYRRLFTTKRFLRFTFCLNMLITAWSSGIFLACALQCRPLRAYWDINVKGRCFSATTFIIVNQAFNVVMDFVILAVPIPMIWRLHRSWQDKLALNAVFALGAFVCFASIYRIIVLFYIDLKDVTYTIYDATLWTHIEPSVGLVVSCLPIIRGMFPRCTSAGHKQRTTSSLGHSSTGTTWSGGMDQECFDGRKGLRGGCAIGGRTCHRSGNAIELENIRVTTDIEVQIG
ncbi:uncharacterized protein BO87DRAFT_353456 [Aspergillus neoniger CBS 115656]|uniref:Integral membrane protein n=2 Tax=Aspergillus subgen. Circumdati TaxID=2720871 RepID=A0A318YS01_ASPNB|nr:integral membrane protein [Aspergillus neoniger CBS 115656]XP_025544930.1 integral membrane protein [Aspergillus costaricaensis CBS 115574]PYH37104.1 integral membrane protein [Aspergillus neoniger CBS 115656]RAK94095.1 integral membrane protein [Aspergillus costaricaensis CBS 115574]